MAVAFQLRLAPKEDFRRESLDSPVDQGTNETRKYLVDFADWGVADDDPVMLASTTVNVYSVNEYKQDDQRVTSIVVGGSTTVDGDSRVYFQLSSLVAGSTYRWKAKVELVNDTLEAYGFIRGTA